MHGFMMRCTISYGLIGLTLIGSKVRFVGALERADALLATETSFLDELRRLPGSQVRFSLARVKGTRTAVATQKLKRGAVVARTPQKAVIGQDFSEGHRLLARQCAQATESQCSNSVFAAAALWLCTAPSLGCHSYAEMLPNTDELRNFPGFSDAHRAFAYMLEPKKMENWIVDFEQLRALIVSSTSELKRLRAFPKPTLKGRTRDLNGSLWWALGVASTRAMIQPESVRRLGHVDMALFPGIDMFNFHPNSSEANAKYDIGAEHLDVVTTRSIKKGDEILIAADQNLPMSQLTLLANQGIVMDELPYGPEMMFDPQEVPFDHEKAEQFGCLEVPGHLSRLVGGKEKVLPPMLVACVNVMWYPLQKAERAIAAGHLRYEVLPATMTKTHKMPSKKHLRQWQVLDRAAETYVTTLCSQGAAKARKALNSRAGRMLNNSKDNWLSGALLGIAQEFIDIYQRCQTELGTVFNSRASSTGPQSEL